MRAWTDGTVLGLPTHSPFLRARIAGALEHAKRFASAAVARDVLVVHFVPCTAEGADMYAPIRRKYAGWRRYVGMTTFETDTLPEYPPSPPHRAPAASRARAHTHRPAHMHASHRAP